jgi:hypothetical protein
MEVILMEITSIRFSQFVEANIIELVSINHLVSCFMEIEVVFVDSRAAEIIADFEVNVAVKNLLNKDLEDLVAEIKVEASICFQLAGLSKDFHFTFRRYAVN